MGELRAKSSKQSLKRHFPEQPSSRPSQTGRLSSSSHPESCWLQAVGQGWGCPALAVGDIGDLVPGPGPPRLRDVVLLEMEVAFAKC